MVVFLVLFGVAIIVTLIGWCLSLSSRTRSQKEVAAVLGSERGVSQRNRARNVLLDPAIDEPYRPLRRSYTAVGHVGGGRGQALSLQAPAHRLYSPSERTGVDDSGGLWGTRFPRWLKLTLFSGPIFGLCLLLFVHMVNPNGISIILNNSAPQVQPFSKDSALFVQNLGASNASRSIVRIAALDRSQYSSDDEYNQWAYSVCSTASMAEVINAYGHNYRLADVLKVEIDMHAISPELGLLEDKGIDRTIAKFGFKMVPLEHATLDGAIAVANQGHPVIVSFRNSDYWRGGHILVLRGGDAQNVNLADSSRLDLTTISRAQFLQWWGGFVALAVPQ